MRPTHPNHTDSPSVESIARPAASTHRPRKRFPSLPAVPSKVAKPPQALDAAWWSPGSRANHRLAFLGQEDE